MIKYKNNPYYIIFKYKQFIKELPQYNHTHQNSNKIFWCWLLGEKNAPTLAKACLNSVKRYCKGHEIVIITEKKINQYIHVPPYIFKKYKKHYIGPAHFADLLRLELLIKYGGTWIDSSVLITDYNKIFFNNDLFYFQINNSKFFAGSNWFITSEKGSPILRTTLDLLYEFWAKNNSIYHYYLFHIFLKMACNKYMNDYKKIPWYSNKPVHTLQLKLFKPYINSTYQKILDSASIHKLTNKRKTNITKGLNYHHILEDFSSINIL